MYPQEEKQPLSLDAPSEAGVPLIETLAGQDAYVQMETGLEIESYLSCLTPDESHAITLKSQGSTDEEIAQWMGKSLFAAKDALKRARKKAETHRKKI